MAVKVRERKGAYWLFVDWHGRRKAKRIGVGAKGKRLAENAAVEIHAKLLRGDLSVFDAAAPASPAPAVPTFRELAERWLAVEVPLRCKASSARAYAVVMKAHWLPRFGNRPVTAIARDDVLTALAELSREVSGTTLRYGVLPPLRALLTFAVERGHLPVSPAAALGKYLKRLLADQLPQERLDPFTADELGAILETAARDYAAWYPAILTAARTGLRFGEWTALQPDDLDFRGGAILVRRAAYLGEITTPKSGKGRRVDMSAQLARVLQGWLTLQEAEAAVEGRPAGPWLFPGADGAPLARRRFADAVWRPIVRLAGVRFRPPHQLRHAFASLLIAQGESLAYVWDQLGHHSIKLTVDTYGHWLPGSNRQAVDRLDAIGPSLEQAGFASPSASIRNPAATVEADAR